MKESDFVGVRSVWGQGAIVQVPRLLLIGGKALNTMKNENPNRVARFLGPTFHSISTPFFLNICIQDAPLLALPAPIQ